MEEFLTVCPRNCYSTCSFRVFTEGGKIKRILPYKNNLATPEGPCIKGLSYLEREQSKDRILHPLRRNQSGGFDRISKDEALDLIAAKLLEAKNNHGPHSVLFFKGSGNSGLSNDISSAFWKLFGGATTLYGNLCWPAGLEAVRLTMGEVKHNVPWDLANAGLIIMWGKNPAETNIQEMIHIGSALKKGAKLVVIDPRRTPTADKADILVRPKQGTDAALALAVAKRLIETGNIDHGFIDKYVTGFDEFAKSLTINAREASEITGIPADAINDLADMIGRTERVTIVAGFGLQRYPNGGQTIRSILSIPVITGKIGKPGCGFNFANLQGYIFDDVKEPQSYYPVPENDKPFRRCLSVAKFASDFGSVSNPGIEVAWIERGNPVVQLPDGAGVRKAIESIPFKVVVDQFITDTASLADIILPAKGIFEQPDIVSSYWHPYVQYKPAITDPPEDVMPESEIYYHLAGRMNLNDIGANPLPQPGNDSFEKWIEGRIYGKGISLETLRRGPVIPDGIEEIAWQNKKFLTRSGKIELYSTDAQKLWGADLLPRYVSLINEGGDFMLMSPCTGSRIHSQFGNMEVIKSVVEKPAWEMSVPDARKLGIKDGDIIRVWNKRSEVKGVARVTSRVKHGSVVFPNGFWLNEGGGVNALINGAETDMGHGTAFHNCRVNIEKADR